VCGILVEKSIYYNRMQIYPEIELMTFMKIVIFILKNLISS